MLACAYPSFDRLMILFQDVIQVRHRPVLAILLKGTFGFETHDRRWVSSVLVGVNNPRLGMVRTSQSFTQEALRSSRARLGREQEVDRRPSRVHSAVLIDPLALDPYVGRVHPPTVVGRFELRAQTAFHFRG